MAEGIGFGAEGDWKTSCLYRTLWVMSQGLPTGCSFLEDYINQQIALKKKFYKILKNLKISGQKSKTLLYTKALQL